MQPTAVLAPLFAYVLLIFVVWVELYRRRMDYITSNKIHPQKLADATDAKELLKPAQAPANNFVNQFELPMLFFLAGIIAYVTKSASTLVVGLMWVFVALRAVHSIIHLGGNVVIRRFYTYLVASVVLFALWVVLAIRLFL